MGLIERLRQQPHHIRLNTHDKEGRTGILRPLEWGWVVTTGNISTGTVSPPMVLGRSGLPILWLPFYKIGSTLGPTHVFRPKTPEGPCTSYLRGNWPFMSKRLWILFSDWIQPNSFRKRNPKNPWNTSKRSISITKSKEFPDVHQLQFRRLRGCLINGLICEH